MKEQKRKQKEKPFPKMVFELSISPVTSFVEEEKKKEMYRGF